MLFYAFTLLRVRAAVNFFEENDMAESDNILTKLQDLLVYLIPQLNRAKAHRTQPVSRGFFPGNEYAGVIGAGSRRARERPDDGA